MAEFEKTNHITALQAELADINSNIDAWERAAARRKLIELMVAFEADILRPGVKRWEEILQLGNEIERRWPNQRMTCDLPCLPPGIFSLDGMRSLPVWFKETLCAAEPGLFEPDDPVRQKIDAMRAEHAIRIWYPTPPEWRL